MKKLVFVTVMAFLSVACNGDSVQHVKLAELEIGEKVEIVFLSGEKTEDQAREKEMQEKLSLGVAGKKKVIDVKTIYKNGFLFSAEVIYVSAEKDSEVKIVFITSGSKYLPERQKEVISLLKTKMGEIPVILDVQSVYQNGYLIAVEIYHQ